MARCFGFGLAMVFVALPLGGCATHTETGALAGGGLGAATGALIGSASGHTGAGALIGAGAGALAGSLIGNEKDQQERANAARLAAATAPGPMTIADVVNMTQSQVAEDTIIMQIRSTRSVFQVTPQDVIWLKQQGVSDRVVQAMLASNQRYPRRVYGDGVVVEPVYVVAPPPPPPPVSFGVSYGVMRVR